MLIIFLFSSYFVNLNMHSAFSAVKTLIMTLVAVKIKTETAKGYFIFVNTDCLKGTEKKVNAKKKNIKYRERILAKEHTFFSFSFL